MLIQDRLCFKKEYEINIGNAKTLLIALYNLESVEIMKDEREDRSHRHSEKFEDTNIVCTTPNSCIFHHYFHPKSRISYTALVITPKR